MQDNLTNRIGFNQLQDLQHFLYQFWLRTVEVPTRKDQTGQLAKESKLQSYETDSVDLKPLISHVQQLVFDNKEAITPRIRHLLEQKFRNAIAHFNLHQADLSANNQWNLIQHGVYEIVLACNQYLQLHGKAPIPPISCRFFKVNNILDSQRLWNHILPTCLQWIESCKTEQYIEVPKGMEYALGNLFGAMALYHTQDILNCVIVTTVQDYETTEQPLEKLTTKVSDLHLHYNAENPVSVRYILTGTYQEIVQWRQNHSASSSTSSQYLYIVSGLPDNTTIEPLKRFNKELPNDLSDDELKCMLLLDYAREVKPTPNGHSIGLLSLYPDAQQSLIKKGIFIPTSINTIFLKSNHPIYSQSTDAQKKQLCDDINELIVSYHLNKGVPPTIGALKVFVALAQENQTNRTFLENTILLIILKENTGERLQLLSQMMMILPTENNEFFSSLAKLVYDVEIAINREDPDRKTRINLRIQHTKLNDTPHVSPDIRALLDILKLQIEYICSGTKEKQDHSIEKKDHSIENLRKFIRTWSFPKAENFTGNHNTIQTKIYSPLTTLHMYKMLVYLIVLPQLEDYNDFFKQDRDIETQYEKIYTRIAEFNIKHTNTPTLNNVLSRLETHLAYLKLYSLLSIDFENKTEETLQKLEKDLPDILYTCDVALRRKVYFRRYTRSDGSVNHQIESKSLDIHFIYFRTLGLEIPKKYYKDILNEIPKNSTYDKAIRKHCRHLVLESLKEKVYPNLIYITTTLDCSIDDITSTQIDEFLQRANNYLQKETAQSSSLKKKITETIPLMFRILRFYQLNENPLTDIDITIAPHMWILKGEALLRITQFLIRVSSQTDQRFLQYIKDWNLENDEIDKFKTQKQ